MAASAVQGEGSWQDVLVGRMGQDPLTEDKVDTGHFWIEWDDVVRYFSHLYLSWCPPALGEHAVTLHGRFEPTAFCSESSMPDDTHVVAFNPQFLLRLEDYPQASLHPQCSCT